MNTIQFADNIFNAYDGEVEIEVRDLRGQTHERRREHNLIKIPAKEILAHRIPHAKVWDPNGGTGEGDWVTHNIDLNEFSAKYIVFGASFDADGNPMDETDSRYYIDDSTVGSPVPKALGAGLVNDGGLINPVPIAEPYRPLKRIERIYFEPSYQPAGTPLLQPDVRCLNNIVVMETTLRKDEYNGFGLTSSDFFRLTEVALVGAAEVGSVGACECDPRDIFLTSGSGTDHDGPLPAFATGTATVSLMPGIGDVDHIKEGDQIKITGRDTSGSETLNQLNPFYLVTDKPLGGHDITLDRTPVTEEGVAISDEIGLWRDGFRMFSQRILKTPVNKSEDFEIIVRWRLIMN